MTSVRDLPLILHTPGVLELRLTLRPEFALATKVTGVRPSVWAPGLVKLIVWLASTTPAAEATVKLWLTPGAAL